MSSKFEERETASENMYARGADEKKINALREQLEKAKRRIDELQSQIDNAEAGQQ